MKTVNDFKWDKKIALLRADLNVPINDGVITDFTRINAVIPTIKKLLELGAGVTILSHLGRPQIGDTSGEFSLAPVSKALAERLDTKIKFCHSLDEAERPKLGKIIMLENTRLNKNEITDDIGLGTLLADLYARLGDIFVMDAFATIHRSDTSLLIGRLTDLPKCAGLLVARELKMLKIGFAKAQKPITVVVGGKKISEKLGALQKLCEIADHILVGGGIANTLLVAKGIKVGNSIFEQSMISTAKELLAKYPNKINLPTDVIVGASLEQNNSTNGERKLVDEVDNADMILDIGGDTADKYSGLIYGSGTVIWNGAMGVFENPAFAGGTMEVAGAIAKSKGFSVAGGGETAAAINAFHMDKEINYVTTAGTAFLNYIEGKELPALDALNDTG